MNDRDRLQHLQGLLVRLEALPPSADRDWMLSEVRGRAVDVDSGVMPAALRIRPADDARAAETTHVEALSTPARRESDRVKAPARASSRPTSPATRASAKVRRSFPSLPPLRERVDSAPSFSPNAREASALQ